MYIETIAIIGATDLGCQFAALALRAGCRTILEDISVSVLDRATGMLRGLMPTKCSAAPRRATAELILAHSVEEAIRDADLIIEAVADELEMKLELFTIFDKFAKPGAVFATTSATLGLTDLADITFRPERCIGLRLLSGGDSQSLQIVRCTVTSDEVVAACRELAKRMKLPAELFSANSTVEKEN